MIHNFLHEFSLTISSIKKYEITGEMEDFGDILDVLEEDVDDPKTCRSGVETAVMLPTTDTCGFLALPQG